MPKYNLPPTLRQILSTPSPAALDTFDPWNSVSTGHQRAETASITQSTGWRGVRNRQLTGQFGGRTTTGGGNGEVGWRVEQIRGDRERKKRKWRRELEREGEGGGGRSSGDIRSFLGGVVKNSTTTGSGTSLKRKKATLDAEEEKDRFRPEGKRRAIQAEKETQHYVPELIVQKGGGALCFEANQNNDYDYDYDYDYSYDDDCTTDAIKMLVEGEGLDGNMQDPANTNGNENVNDNNNDNNNSDTKNLRPQPQPQPQPSSNAPKQIFANLSIYINGSTSPLISDHKLKRILASHGANISSHLARRTITHVILGCPNGNRTTLKGSNANANANVGAGGGLAARKLQCEIQRVGGKGVKFVGVEWVLESIKAGRRLPETRFADLHMAPGKQRSVLDDFGMVKSAS